MRILYFADIRFPLERANGIQTMETCHALAMRGHEVRLVVRPDTHAPPRDPFVYYGLPRSPRLIVERVPAAGPQFARRVAYLSFAAGRVMGAARADVLMSRDLGTAAILSKMPRAVRAPIVYESHGYAPDVAAALPEMVTTARPPGAARLKRLTEREAAVWRDADGYITITAGLARVLEEKFGKRSHTAVVPDGVRVNSTPDSPETSDAQVVVGYAGHLYPWKGVDVLVEALPLLPDVQLRIVGGHPGERDLARLHHLAARRGVEARVEFTGLVPPFEVGRWLQAADVLVLPNRGTEVSARYTSPLKLFEYLGAGRPIVASRLPALAEVLRDEENALLVEPDQPAALAAAITRVIDDRALAVRLARRAFETAAEFTWAKRAERLESVLEEARRAR